MSTLPLAIGYFSPRQSRGLSLMAKAAGDAPVNGASPAGNARLIQLRRDQPKTPTALRMTTAIRQITEATAQGTVTYFTDCLVFRWKN